MTTLPIYAIDKERVDEITPMQDGQNYDDWEKVMLMVTLTDKISGIIGWAKREPLPEALQVAVTYEDYEKDKGICIDKVVTVSLAGAKTVRYVRKRKVDLVVSGLGFDSVLQVKGELAPVYVSAEFKKGSAITFWKGECYEYMYKMIMPRLGNGMVKYYEKEQEFNLTAYLVPFVALGNFKNYIDRYAENPDKPGTVFKTFTLEDCDLTKLARNEYPAEESEVFTERLVNLESAAKGLGTVISVGTPDTTADVAYALAYTNLFLMVKPGQPEHLKSALKSRLSAMKNALKYEDLNVDEFITKRISWDQYKQSYERLSFYPKLKSLIFSCVLSNNDDFNTHIKGILKEAQFTVFNLMVTFVYAPELTILHVVGEVMSDYEKFVESYRELKLRYGENWPYCKLVNPNESAGVLSKFPFLQHAAKAYAFATQKSESLGNLQGMKAVPKYYFYYAKQKLCETSTIGIQSAAKVKTQLKCIRGDADLEFITDDLLTTAKDAANLWITDKSKIDPFFNNFFNKEQIA